MTSLPTPPPGGACRRKSSADRAFGSIILICFTGMNATYTVVWIEPKPRCFDCPVLWFRNE